MCVCVQGEEQDLYPWQAEDEEVEGARYLGQGDTATWHQWFCEGQV